jgi:hypothetical protein
MYPALVALAACAGDSTAPSVPETAAQPTAPSEPTTPLGFRVHPGTITLEVNQRFRFRGEFSTGRGSVRTPPMEWKSTGGTIEANGTFSADRPGRYRVIGRSRERDHTRGHRPDTSVVVVVPRQPDVIGVRVTPRAPRLQAGQRRAFTAVGRLPNRTNTAIRVNWSASGGSIDRAGVFRAGSVPGTYRVIASNLRGTLADTIPVTIQADEPPAPPAGVAARIVLRPATIVLATSSGYQFAAFGRTSEGDSIAVEVTYSATGGTITQSGLYTAGPSAGSYSVVASAGPLADTALVTLARTSGGGTPLPGPTPLPEPGPTPTPLPEPTPPPVGTGIPMGLSGLLVSGRDPMHYTASLDGYTADNIVGRLATARQKRIRLLMNMTGGGHDQYKTGGVFDYSKWKAKMDSYNTPAIRAAVAEAVANGTIIGNSVMDEPANVSPKASWGPAGTMTKERVDGMCLYVKQMFPTLPVGVVHDHRLLDPSKNYQHCDFILSQYRLSKGEIREFRDAGLAFARRSGISIAFSLNILHGGVPGTDCEKWGDDPHGKLCPMTPDQVREWGTLLGSAGCALNMWRYERAYFDKPEVQRALQQVGESLARLPGKSCRRP